MAKGGLLGGIAAGFMAGQSMKGKAKGADTSNPEPKFTPEASASTGPSDAQIASNTADLKSAGLADGGMVRDAGHNRYFGKKPCK
jgi:hypothetical protein